MSKRIRRAARRILLLLLSAQISILAQTPQKSEAVSWVRVESENREISVAVPENFSFLFDPEGFFRGNTRAVTERADFKDVRALTAYENGAVMFFESYRTANAKKVVSYFLDDHRDVKATRLAFGNFSGLEIISDRAAYAALYYLASGDNVYLIGVGARRRDNPAVAKFLNSVKIDRKTVFNLASARAVEPGKTVSISDLRETPPNVATLSPEERDELKRKSKESQSKKTGPDADNEGLIVFFKPRAQYTESARKRGEQGKIVLQAAFGADGQLSEIKIVEGLRYGLNEETINALRRIRFIPAEKDGAPSAVTKLVEYTFTIY